MRLQLTILLLLLGCILAFLPLSGKYTLQGSPEKLLADALDPETYVTADQVARYVVSDDSTIRLFDLRPTIDFEKSSIPGSVNIPYSEFLESDLESMLNTGARNIFYSDDVREADYALVLAKGLGFADSYVMQGGLDSWNHDIMNSSFTGDTISARENALYEVRTRARKLYTEINSMPDSLKALYRASLEIERKKLDGGCE